VVRSCLPLLAITRLAGPQHLFPLLTAHPELHMLTRPPGKTFFVAECLVCGFYPQSVTVQWLQNGEPVQAGIYESEVEQNPNGTFSTGSVFFPQQGHFAASYTCQVQHEALEKPRDVEAFKMDIIIC
uniref:Ig-like domain-containing protein n=1 Tax=Podarcis muralis TaxID=64176 RepID=A0A670K640_PODMU